MLVKIIIFTIIGIVLSIVISTGKDEKVKKDEVSFSDKFKTLISELANRLWDGENHIVMKKSSTQYIIQKSKTPSFQSHIQVDYKQSTIKLKYYETSMGVEINYSKTYSISNNSNEEQIAIAKDFNDQVFVNSEMKF